MDNVDLSDYDELVAFPIFGNLPGHFRRKLLERLKVMPMEIAHDFPGGEWRRVQRAEGYKAVVLNGEVTFEDGRETGALPGRLLRHGL